MNICLEPSKGTTYLDTTHRPSIGNWSFGIRQQPRTMTPVEHLHCCHHWPRHAARCVARPMLYGVARPTLPDA
jgi:hypothetical protein